MMLQRLQQREVQKLHLEDPDTRLRAEGLVDVNEPESGNLDVDGRVKRYRELFAGLLATYVGFVTQYEKCD